MKAIIGAGLVLIGILASVILTHAKDFSGNVVDVPEGDMIVVARGQDEIRIRLEGVDAPEPNQSYGPHAREFTSRRALGKSVVVLTKSEDKYGYGWVVGEVILPDGANLSHDLLKAGYAWWYRAYSNDKTLGQMEEEARKARRGLWADLKPQPPWEWRKARGPK
ncbi:MAG: thermonuclease family protein [Deltaproteobacteria bacterium]|nr:thermonuclease family protein [Deltaproteobacteria bacterium]